MAQANRKGSEHKKKVIRVKGKTPKKYPRLAIVDHLTGLHNRRFFDKTLKKFVFTSKKNKKHFSLLMVDIDNFKNINDRYGHLVGDRVLKNVGKLLKESVREIDICFRYGGDEIAIILPNAENKDAGNILERLKKRIEKHKFPISRHNRVQLKLSIGLAVFPKDGQEPEALIKRTDELLYRVKHQKKRKEEMLIEPFILKTKLTIPALKETVISRPRLISLLKENLNKKLIHVVADAGYGKTTLLTQLIYDQNLASVFYNLDKADSDLMLFLSYIIEGLNQNQPNLAKLASNLLKQGTEVTLNYELIMGTLINELNEKIDRKLYFVLDDYHNISKNSLVHRALDYFVNNMPNRVHVIISSRTVPALFSLAKLRSKQHLFELSRKDLKFTSEEIKALLSRVYKVLLTEEELRRVSDHTEGWITGIQLILQTAGKDRKTVKETLNGYIAANQPLFEYFANEILIAESPRVQNFLKQSSVLEVMTPEACNNILRIKDSIKLLCDLQRRNLFVSAVGEDEYKYHLMFRQFLQDRFSNIQLRRSLNLRAAQYYKQKGKIEQAIQHYLEVRDYPRAGKLIVQIEGQMRTQARYTTLNTWCEQIPERVLQKQSQLLTMKGRLYWIQGHLLEAEETFIQAEQLLKDEDNMSALAEALHAHGSLLLSTGSSHEKTLKTFRKALKACPVPATKLKGEILISIGTLYRVVCDFKKARTYWLKAYRIVEQINDFHNILAIGNNLALLLLTQGELKIAFKSFKQLIDRIGDNYWVEVGIIFANAAGGAIAHGKLEWAEKCLDKGWALCRSYEDPFSKIGLHESFALLYIYKERWDLAEQHLFRAMDGCKKLQWAIVEFYLFGLMVRFYRYKGDLAKAKKYLKMMWERLSKKQTIQEVSCLVETSFLHIALEEFEKAEKSIRKSMRLIQRFGLNRHKFFSYLVLASVYLAKHRDREASKVLRRAVRLAKIKGFDGLLARELHHNLHLARFIQKNNIESGYIASLGLPKDMRKIVLQIQYFGGLHLRDSKGKPVSLTWITEKSRSLFAFLVAHRGLPVHREIIIEKFWPNLPKNRANERFRNTASRMRQSLLNVLPGELDQDKIFICQRGTYQLLPEVEFRIDTEQFNLLLKEAERTESSDEKVKFIRQALDLYKGDYLPEVYDSWTDAIRLGLRERWLGALHWFADYLARQGDDHSCAEACETYLSVDPLSEEITRLCMKVLNRLGQVATIKERYKSLKQVLRRELNCAPSKETQDLYLSILKSHPKT